MALLPAESSAMITYELMNTLLSRTVQFHHCNIRLYESGISTRWLQHIVKIILVYSFQEKRTYARAIYILSLPATNHSTQN
jgi:hypothetical protein